MSFIWYWTSILIRIAVMKYTEAFSVSFLWFKNLEFLSHYKCHFPNLKIPGSIAAWMMAHFLACAPDSALHFGCIHLILCAAVPSDFSIYPFTFLKVKRPSPRESQLQGPIPFILNFLTFIPICVTLYFMCHWPVSHPKKAEAMWFFLGMSPRASCNTQFMADASHMLSE